MQRLAGSIWNTYKNNGLVQDAAETLIGAGIGAGGQLLFTDMDASEIGQSAAIGAGLAMAARPIGARVGYAAGRAVDKAVPNAMRELEQFVPITRKGMAASLKQMRKEGMPREFATTTREVLTAKRNQNAFKPDGTERGSAETILGYYGRNRADNVAQFGFAALSPFIYGGDADQPEQNTLGM